jgi:predicted secreted protein
LSGAAFAADAAESLPFGYSADGTFFAFEQFGIQDGSGFPYADIFVLDLAANSWVEGTPIRVLLEDETATLGAAHAKAVATAQSIIFKHKVTEPAFVLASTPSTEVQDDRGTVTFDPYYRHMGGSMPQPTADMWGTRYTLEATTGEVIPTPDHCKDFGEAVMGLTLTLTDLKTGAKQTIHKDTSIPKSRGCPSGYDIDKVVAPATDGPTSRFVALIGVYSMGFEGRDRRYIALPVNPE